MKKSRGFTLLELLTTMFIIAALASLIFPNIRKAMDKGRLSGCQSNLRALATQLQLYANDNETKYPSTLTILIPKYIRAIPECPAAAIDTYTAGYATSIEQTVFTICCKGKNHELTNLGEDEPYYDMVSGLGPK
jgi:prepilin-type N-terminal cleavage/methylation domain-containing protein